MVDAAVCEGREVGLWRVLELGSEYRYLERVANELGENAEVVTGLTAHFRDLCGLWWDVAEPEYRSEAGDVKKYL